MRVQVVDELGGVIVGATVTLSDESGVEKRAVTDDQGISPFDGLMPGLYTVSAAASGFGVDEKHDVKLAGGRREQLSITLKVTIEEQNVTVSADQALSLDPENNADALVLRKRELESLPDDPDELAAALQVLAGPSAGPNGGEILVDGFKARHPPPKNTIREVRIHQNPFSAENDRLGSRSIEIFTKPGTNIFTGRASFNYNNQNLNSRNPFASNRAPFQSRLYGFNLSGPIVVDKTSFFLDFERRDINDNAVINATILDPALNIVPFSEAVLTPTKWTAFSVRIEHQLNKTNTLLGRYAYTNSSLRNAGVGQLSLLSRAFDTSGGEHTLQLTETAILNKSMVNEMRFQYVHTNIDLRGDNSVPALRVLDAFTGGGAQVGSSFNRVDRWEFQNTLAWQRGNHAIKIGGRLRGVRLTDSSSQNFGGTFIFAGGTALQLDANNQIVLNAQGQPVLVPITSIERYRRTLLFQGQGLTPAAIRSLGGGATQFTIAAGETKAQVSQVDIGAFIQDDWRVRRNFALSLGLRYENQSNLSSNLNFAPRIRFAWMPGKTLAGQPRTVIRGGIGIFYDRFNENLTLLTSRFDGVKQQQFVASSPDVVDLFPNVPSIETLNRFAIAPTRWRVAGNLRTPYTYQAAIGIDRMLPYSFTLSTTYLYLRTLHALRARNINSPVLGTFATGAQVRPLGDVGDVFQIESSGVYKQHLLIFVLNSRFNKRATFYARYILGKASSNTDGPVSFPLNSYDTSIEFGRALGDVRHRFLFGGTLTLPWAINLSPLVIATSGAPFNITTGEDTNGDTLFTERPAFATDLTRPGVVATRFGVFDPNPAPGQPVIPRNFGRGPAFFTVNLRLSKSFNLSGHTNAATSSSSQQDQGGKDRKYRLTFGIQVFNILNRTNAGTPIGNLSSPLFGRSNSSFSGLNLSESGSTAAGNRRAEAQIIFDF